MRHKLIIASLVLIAASCGPKNDGDASTREPIPPTATDTGSLSPAYGDTTLKMDPSTATDSSSAGSTNGGGTMARDSSMSR
ncbi:MAG TPA: hypothetical protein VM935_07745 [Chitinophagaceae bacterium]|nr:hypothetical protein [Chitinophagaceae bacterium]